MLFENICSRSNFAITQAISFHLFLEHAYLFNVWGSAAELQCTEQTNAQCHFYCQGGHLSRTGKGDDTILKDLSWRSPNLPEIHRGSKGAESLLGNNDFQYLPVNSKLENILWGCRILFIILTDCVHIFTCVWKRKCQVCPEVVQQWKESFESRKKGYRWEKLWSAAHFRYATDSKRSLPRAVSSVAMTK